MVVKEGGQTRADGLRDGAADDEHRDPEPQGARRRGDRRPGQQAQPEQEHPDEEEEERADHAGREEPDAEDGDQRDEQHPARRGAQPQEQRPAHPSQGDGPGGGRRRGRGRRSGGHGAIVPSAPGAVGSRRARRDAFHRPHRRRARLSWPEPARRSTSWPRARAGGRPGSAARRTTATCWTITTEWDSVGAYRRALSDFDVKVTAVPLLSLAARRAERLRGRRGAWARGSEGMETGSGLAEDPWAGRG